MTVESSSINELMNNYHHEKRGRASKLGYCKFLNELLFGVPHLPFSLQCLFQFLDMSMSVTMLRSKM